MKLLSAPLLRLQNLLGATKIKVGLDEAISNAPAILRINLLWRRESLAETGKETFSDGLSQKEWLP